ncbi:hypothetical protein SAMN05518669_11321 [Variovorax sp. YR634]|uniref:hypothetical protein n=1 Tax=Variovorax sp. YR634 TaxID=1884385 RepID=UPI0008958CA1|nr:hypothetical protein [Variovorax sp. YR634]SDY52735.1 hypothetical protein SAMN05518669_11321 [Variovorax sp. YR634]
MGIVMTSATEASKEEPAISLKEFFEDVPPAAQKSVKEAFAYSNGDLVLALPQIMLHCSSDICSGRRLFHHTKAPTLYISPQRQPNDVYIYYFCKNCGGSRKTFALTVRVPEEPSTGLASLMKLAEHPPFGPPTPARVATLVGSDRDLYFKGLRAENQGLGIAAFAYYRRVVEDRKGAIIDEIIRVAEKVGGTPELLAELAAARKETQFSAAVDTVKIGIPPALLINGHNPLTLLHSALSEGLHADSDAVCLELATSIRVVLASFVERVQSALSDEKELSNAVSRLLQKNSSKQKNAGSS